MAKTSEEKIKSLNAQIAQAEEEGDEVYLNYLLRIREMTINNYGTIYFQAGNPPPPPPYGGGG